MSVLDDARRLAADDEISDCSDRCVDQIRPVLPKIVAALEAAEALLVAKNAQSWSMETPIALQPWGADPACYWCGGEYNRAHTDGCPWQALVAALKGDDDG